MDFHRYQFGSRTPGPLLVYPPHKISPVTNACGFTDIILNKVEILFNSLIRPLLEYGSPAWNPWYSKDITNIEKVQRRCYKLCNSPEFEPEPLVIRRLKTDLCEVYKYLHDMYKSDKSLFLHYHSTLYEGTA